MKFVVQISYQKVLTRFESIKLKYKTIKIIYYLIFLFKVK